MEPAVRRLNKTNKMVQARILPFNSVVRFLKIVRFAQILIFTIDWV